MIYLFPHNLLLKWPSCNQDMSDPLTNRCGLLRSPRWSFAVGRMRKGLEPARQPSFFFFFLGLESLAKKKQLAEIPNFTLPICGKHFF